ncbi:hypothetical protein ACQ4PT_062578 [Festuca glaucescens]
MVVLKYSSYKLNGIDFHTQSYDEGRPVQGSGVALIAQTTSFQKGNGDNTSVRNKAYYGIIKEILELNYQHEGKVVLLKCDWVDNRVEDKWVKTDQFGITSVNFKHLFNTGEKMSDEPFILASQATQVYYVEDPIDAEWSTVVIPSYYDINEAENINPDNALRTTLLDPCTSIRVSVANGDIGSSITDIDGLVVKKNVPFTGKMASRRGKSKDVMVTNEQLAEVEYELPRNMMVEENEQRMALLGIRKTSSSLREVCEASRPPKQRKRKEPSSALENTTERCVLRSRGANQSDNANPTYQPSKEITTKLVNGEKGGRTITKKANIYARMNKMKIKIPFNEHGQPIGPDATEFANFIGTLVRKHIPPKTIDWIDVDEEKKLLVWDHLQTFYELESIALKYVINTSQRKWKEWKADLKKTKFDPELTDEELMPNRDDRISEANWKDLLKYWRSPEFDVS